MLHGVWLRLGNLPQAVGALAQAKQRAEQQSAAAGSTSHRHGVMGTPPTPSAALGGALWDQIQRDDEISSAVVMSFQPEKATPTLALPWPTEAMPDFEKSAK